MICKRTGDESDGIAEQIGASKEQSASHPDVMVGIAFVFSVGCDYILRVEWH